MDVPFWRRSSRLPLKYIRHLGGQSKHIERTSGCTRNAPRCGRFGSPTEPSPKPCSHPIRPRKWHAGQWARELPTSRTITRAWSSPSLARVGHGGSGGPWKRWAGTDGSPRSSLCGRWLRAPRGQAQAPYTPYPLENVHDKGYAAFHRVPESREFW